MACFVFFLLTPCCSCSAVDDDDAHLSAGFIGLHDAMRFADLLEAKQSGRLLANAAALGDFAAHRSTEDPHR